MSIRKSIFSTFAVLLAMAVSAFASSSGTAKLQVIHNAADPAAELVDIWVNGQKAIADFAFRTATGFLELPANQTLTIGVAGAGSQSTDDILATFPVTLKKNRTYVAVANGVLDPSQFDDGFNGNAIAFNLFQKTNARTGSWWPNRVDLLAFHGSTDAPKVDVWVRDRERWPLFNNLEYGEFSNYRTVKAQSYILEVTPFNDRNTVVAAFEADLSGLGRGAAVVFASGFLNPANNQNGPAFGLFAALPNGTVIELPAVAPEEKFARLQIIHNAADPSAASVDIWVNGTPFLTNVNFRAATPFVDVPAEVLLNIGIAPAGSDDIDDTLVNFPITLEDNKTYVAIANGVLGGGFAPNPDGQDITFNIFTRDDVRESAYWRHVVSVLAFHGATDAPTVDIIGKKYNWSWTLFNNLTYGEFSGYRNLLPTTYEVVVTPGNDQSTEVARFEVDLTGLGGGAAVVFASGFLNPSENGGGPAFGLFAALPDGQVVEFPMVAQPAFARLQVIHNAADPAAEMVDVYVNGNKLLEDFAFRTATPFTAVPAGVELNVGVAPMTSSSANDTIANFTVTLDANVNYIAVANGVVGGGFESNPDGRSIGFTLFTAADARTEADNSGEVDFKVLHGSTDAPTVDVIARNVATLVDDAAYGDFTDYISVPAESYVLDITPGNDNASIVASFNADLSGLAGGAAVVFASGFLSPDNDNNGPAFGLFAALPNGAVAELPAIGPARTPVSASLGNGSLPTEFSLAQNYPNPFNPTTVISFALPTASSVTLSIYNVLGQEVSTLLNTTLPAGEHQVEFDASSYASGVYFYRLSADSFSDTRKMMLVK